MTRLGPALLLLAAAGPSLADAFVFRRALSNPTPAAGDFFGSSVAVSGAGILVGARFDDPGALNAGAAHLFDAGSGTLLRTFTAPVPAAGDQLGFATAAVGADFLLTAPDHDAGASRSGIVYRVAAGSAAPVQTYAEVPPTPGAKLGYAVAALGGDVLAGAPYDGSAGGAFLFAGADGALLQTFVDPTPSADDQFGRAVAGAGRVAAIAAPFAAAGAVNAGVVHLFDGGTGAFLRTLEAPQPEIGDGFGMALAGEGNRLLVGCPFDHASGAVAGAAYLFDAATGTLLRTFVSPAPDARFGSAVALGGNLVLVGAPFADGEGPDTGTAYVFEASTGVLLATLVSPTPRPGDQFGAAVGLSGSTAVIGAWLDDTGADNAGAAYEFVDVSLPTTSSTTSTSTSTSSTTTTSTSVTSTSTTTTTPPAATTTTTSTTPGSLASTSTGPAAAGTTTTSTSLPSCATGFDAVVCGLDAIDLALHEVTPRALGGTRLAARLQRKIARARHLLDAARAPTGSARKLRRAGRAIASFIDLVRRAQRAGRMAHATGDGLLALATDAAVQLAPLR